MANGMGALWVAAGALQTSQNALNTTANNLTNVDTTGYVRQQVRFSDKKYIEAATSAAISKQQIGLGVTISDVVHNRDVFLDQAYRTESGRQAFYSVCYGATTEVENYFQEMDGESFQEILSSEDNSLWVAFQELKKDPSSSVNQNLVFQKASLFITRAQTIYKGLQTYQQQLNTQIADDITKINDLGKTIYELNLEIQKIEANGVQTATDLRDTRDLALDELAKLANISYKELVDGTVKVSLEGVDFVDEAKVHKMGVQTDKTTGFVTPVWPEMGDQQVFNLSAAISSENNTDIGELKALLIARGDKYADYSSVTEMTAEDYSSSIGQSVMLNTQAEFDQLIHSVVTAINDILAPNTTAVVSEDGNSISFNDANGEALYTATLDGDGNYYLTDETGGYIRDDSGNRIQVDADTKFLDTATCSTGSDKVIPPQELFVRAGVERYTTVTGADGSSFYIYNAEDTTDPDTMYTVTNIKINEVIQKDCSKIAHLAQNGEVNYALGDQLAAVWSSKDTLLNPTQTGKLTFAEFYEQLIGELATNGSIYSTTSTNLEGTVASVANQRNQIIGVSSDEELTNMIKYQNAYNAASRYMNVVSEMLEHILSSLG